MHIQSANATVKKDTFVVDLLHRLYHDKLLPNMTAPSLQTDQDCIPIFIDIFQQYFIRSADALLDDLLFFVKMAKGSSLSLSSLAKIGEDGKAIEKEREKKNENGKLPKSPADKNEDLRDRHRIFVKRNMKNGMLPPLNELIDWKETVYLNLITQLHANLIVSICKKKFYTSSMEIVRKKELLVFPSPSKILFITKEKPHDFSYPFIYFNVGDFEHVFGDEFLLQSDQYLCAQLIISLTPFPFSSSSSASKKDPSVIDISGSFSRSMDEPLYLPIDVTGNLDSQNLMGPSMTSNPPASVSTPKKRAVANKLNSSSSRLDIPKDGEIALFEGAVSYDSIWQVHSKKSFRQLKNKDLSASQFILMRGPNGKGHAQVAVSVSRQNQDFSSNLELKENDRKLPIKCALTFVNLHWSQILEDLSKFTKNTMNSVPYL